MTIVDAVAYFRGRVPNAADAAAIAETVRATPGLTEVVNELKLPEAAASSPRYGTAGGLAEPAPCTLPLCAARSERFDGLLGAAEAVVDDVLDLLQNAE